MKNMICLIDDEDSVRKSMSRLLQTAGYNVESYQSAADYLNDENKERFTCMILDYAMPEMNGIQLQHRIKILDIYLPIIFLTAHADVHIGVNAMKQGAIDFLVKPVDHEKLFNTVDRAFADYRKNYFINSYAAEYKQKYESLTEREKEVLDIIANGAKNKEISEALNISEKTVKIHRANIMRKMKVSTPAELGFVYATHGMRKID